MSKATFKQDLDEVDRTLATSPGQSYPDLGELVFKGLDIKTQAAKEFIRVALANARLMDRKQQDYGPRNISSFGLYGVVVRMNDKMERIKTLMSGSRRRKALNESIQDSFRDVSNYGIIALMLDLNRWPME